MSREVEWNKIFFDEFVRLAFLTKDEQDVLEDHVKGYTRLEIHFNRHMSLSKIDAILKRLKEKYDSVQPYSDILPKREKQSERQKKRKQEIK